MLCELSLFVCLQATNDWGNVEDVVGGLTDGACVGW